MGTSAQFGGAFDITKTEKYTFGRTTPTNKYPNRLDLIAHNSNAVYQDNGKVLPLSISKHSYIIYK